MHLIVSLCEMVLTEIFERFHHSAAVCVLSRVVFKCSFSSYAFFFYCGLFAVNITYPRSHRDNRLLFSPCEVTTVNIITILVFCFKPVHPWICILLQFYFCKNVLLSVWNKDRSWNCPLRDFWDELILKLVIDHKE